MTNLKHKDPTVSHPLQREYEEFTSALPDSTYVKMGEERLQSADGRAQAITKLVSLHKGEVVELDPRRTTWRLRPKAPGSASADWQNEQWNCCENGEPVGARADGPGHYEYSKPQAWFIELEMNTQIIVTQQYSGGSRWGLNDLKPDWPAQVNRCILPCQNADTHE